MEYDEVEVDEEKVDEAVLALLYLTSFTEQGITRAWKGHDWDALSRLYERGLIFNPKGKARSVVLTEEGVKESERLFWKIFAKVR